MKTVTLQNKEAVFTKGAKKAIFVSFDYNLEAVERIKRLPVRYFNKETKQWEIPTRNVNEFINVFQDYNVILDGEFTKTIANRIKSVKKFDEIAAHNISYLTTPYKHQKEGVMYGLENNKFLLGDEQGLGKTKQAIDLAVVRKQQFNHVLIVCGVNSLKHNWKAEIATHSNEESIILGQRQRVRGKNKGKWFDGSVPERLEDLKKEDNPFFLITNIETLRDRNFQNEVEKQTLSGNIGMVVIDEIHRAKNSQSTQGKAIHKLRSYYKMALTGTALMNSPEDLYNILKWLDEEQSTVGRFRDRYCEYGGFGGYEIIDYKNLEELRNRLDSVQLRRKKEDVLDLPEKVRTVEYVELEGKQLKLYNDIKEQVISEIDEIALSPNPLAQLIRLRQVTGNPKILDPQFKENAKMERMVELVEEITGSGRKVVIFSEWEKVTAEAYSLLSAYNPAYVAGNSNVEEEKTKFKEEESCKVIIGTRGKLGTGHTLTEASYVIFLDKPWNLANTEQAEDRTHRIGTTETVNIITLVAKDTIDERIEDVIFKKGNMSKALVDGEFGNLDRLDKKEMLHLLLS